MGTRKHDHEERPTRLESIVQRQPAPSPDIELDVLPDRFDRLLNVLGTIDIMVCEFDADGRMIYVSPNVESIYGFDPAEFLEASVEFHPDDLSGVIEAGRRVRTSGEPAANESRIRHKDGRWVWTECSILGWYPSEGGGFHTITLTRDITALKDAEAARGESEIRRRAISQMSCDLISELDESGQATYVAPGCEQVIGYTAEEALALKPWALVHPEDIEGVVARVSREFAAEKSAPEAQASRQSPVIEARLRHQDGRWLWFETMGLSYTRADGEVRYLAVSRDVTERREAENRRREFEESLQRAQKLESLGVLAGGVAHDFNNLLTPILGAARLGLDELPPDSPVRGRLEMIQQAAKRAAALTGQMLSYTGQGPLRVERLDLSKLVGEMRELVASSVSGKVIFDLELQAGLPAVEAEAAQLTQVVMNLVINAAEAQGDSPGRIELKTGVVDVDAPPSGALFAETMGTGRHVYLEVFDTGSGMDEETRSRIFDPFFTTKFTGRGLGLAAVAGIVRAHRGAIQVDSDVGRGTRFRVFLPAVEGEAFAAPPASSSIAGWQTTGTALVIDDDEGVRELAKDVLLRAGLTVLTAGDGHEGVKLFDLHADSIRVVLLDRTMPSLSGADTLDAIRAIRPEAKVVLVSGYSEERVASELAGRGPSGFLKKPFTPEALLARVREVLEERC
jgi:two-component system cell cycle sensor histidine kinase/response regulator CckA